MPPAVPQSCIAVSACIDTPVAPIGWPLAFSPPEGLTGSAPSFCVSPSRIARAFAFGYEAHSFVFDQFRNREAIVRFHKRKIGELDASVPERVRPCRAA